MNKLLTSFPLVILTGAGASKWLGKATTYDIYEAEEFQELCRSAPCNLLVELRQSLLQRGETDPLDLEVILDYALRLTSELELLKAVPYLRNYLPQLQDIRDKLDQAYEQALDFMVDYYGNVDRQMTASLYGPFIDGLRHILGESAIPLFTLNYDEAVESAVDVLQESSPYTLVDGFRAGHRRVWSRHVFDRYASAGGDVTDVVLLKLHGSVSWTRPEGSQTVEMTVDVPRRTPRKEHVVLYPTRHRKPIDQEPFATGYQYFEAALANAGVAVFIGTSFRDKELLEVIRRASDRPKPFTLMAVGPQANTREVASTTGFPRERVRAVTMSFQPDQIPILFKEIKAALSSPGS